MDSPALTPEYESCHQSLATPIKRGPTSALSAQPNIPTPTRYQVEIRPRNVDEWTLIKRRYWDTTLGELARWDTADYPSGDYFLRLKAVDRQGIALANEYDCQIFISLAP